jgi:hypothetical protein
VCLVIHENFQTSNHSQSLPFVGLISRFTHHKRVPISSIEPCVSMLSAFSQKALQQSRSHVSQIPFQPAGKVANQARPSSSGPLVLLSDVMAWLDLLVRRLDWVNQHLTWVYQHLSQVDEMDTRLAWMEHDLEVDRKQIMHDHVRLMQIKLDA